MYFFTFPKERDTDYMILRDGQPKTIGLNVAICATKQFPTSYSIHAVASDSVNVEVLVSDFFEDKSNDAVWMPSISIPSFTISPGVNYFKQGKWKDTNQYLAIRFTPASFTDTAVALRLVLGNTKETSKL